MAWLTFCVVFPLPVQIHEAQWFMTCQRAVLLRILFGSSEAVSGRMGCKMQGWGVDICFVDSGRSWISGCSDSETEMAYPL